MIVQSLTRSRWPTVTVLALLNLPHLGVESICHLTANSHALVDITIEDSVCFLDATVLSMIGTCCAQLTNITLRNNQLDANAILVMRQAN